MKQKTEELQYKTLPSSDMKIDEMEDGIFYLSGYANTKGVPDAYGDIPTSFEGRPVYNFERFKSNPVLLVDHTNSAGYIAGNLTEYVEDENGFRFRARLRSIQNVHNPIVKDAISSFISGYGRALSIGGRWHFEDKNNPDNLTRADIHEVSLVGIGADGNALTRTPKPKSMGEISEDDYARFEMESLIKKYRGDGSRDEKILLTKKIKLLKEYLNAH